uniref:Chitin-binding type-2 domain-containing protein n=1 Tax=Anopheles christyi TaxID=43041 RepID=A0A182KCN4_9DIPT
MCCPGGMYFNPAIEECDVEINVDCQIEPPPCPQTTTTDIPDTTTDMPDTTTITNPAETTIDLSSTETTVVTEETTSSAAIDTTTVQEGPDLAALCAAQSSDSLLELAFPGDCGLYVVCDNKQYINTESCPAGLHFNPELSLCDSPDHAEYFICVGNMTLELLCAPGTIYDAENAWCIIDDVNNPCE